MSMPPSPPGEVVGRGRGGGRGGDRRGDRVLDGGGGGRGEDDGAQREGGARGGLGDTGADHGGTPCGDVTDGFALHRSCVPRLTLRPACRPGLSPCRRSIASPRPEPPERVS